MQYRTKPKGLLLVMAVAAWLCAGTSAAAVSGDVSPSDSFGGGQIDSLAVPLFKSRVLRLDTPIARVSIGNPDIADILIVQAGQIYVLGKDVGSTNVHLWDKGDRLVGTVSVEVTHDLESLKYKLHEMLPGEPIEVFSVQRSIVMRGRISSVVAMQTALRMANAYLAQIQTDTDVQQFEQRAGSRREDKTVGEVINMMEVSGGQQVMLQVKVAEIARSELKRMDAQFNLINVRSGRWSWGGVNGGATFPNAIFEPDSVRVPVFSESAPFGPVISEFAPNPMQIDNQGLFASFLSSSTLFNFALDAAKEKGLAKILAEPTLTTLTGQEANFLSGGEFPIPVPRGDDGVTVEFKEFGVGLNFLPVVLDAQTINIKVNISVSELVYATTSGIRTPETTTTFVIPSLSKRSANATVELKEGQTMGIAGLINESLRQTITKFPGLGDIPVLGALFRSQDFINNESELVILVTPHIAKPIAPEDIRLPTDKFVEPSDVDFYLMGRMEGRSKSGSTGGSGGADSSFGHRVD
jgi:pilus assembly protein CpaC